MLSQKNLKIITILALLSTIFLTVRSIKLNNTIDQYHYLVLGNKYWMEGNTDSALFYYNKISENKIFENSLKEKVFKKGNLNLSQIDATQDILINLLVSCSDKSEEVLKNMSIEELKNEISDCISNKALGIEELKKQKALLSNEGFIKINKSKDVNIYYFGHLKDSMADGFGKAIWNDESFYEGLWKENKRHGEGVFTTKYGDYYEGNYQHDKRHGFGKYYFRNGDYYVGDWEDGKRSGLGTVFSSKGDTLVHGYWENDRLNRSKTRKMKENNE